MTQRPYLVELYNDSGKCVGSFYTDTPMTAITKLGRYCEDANGFDKFVRATCYHKQSPQWELEIK